MTRDFHGVGFLWLGCAKTLVTTPNSDVIYAMGYVDLAQDGPLVIEVPPRLQGILDDFWQRPLGGPTIDGHMFVGDVGFGGPDKGQGGKYLLLPPGYAGEPPAGYFVYRSRTNNVFVFWRAFFRDPDQLAEPVKLIEQTRSYPLGKQDAAKPMQFPDASGVPVNMLFPADGSYFEDAVPFHRQRGPGPGRRRLARHAGGDRHRQGPAVQAGRAHRGDPRQCGEDGVQDLQGHRLRHLPD